MRAQAHAHILRLEEHLVAPGTALASRAGGLGTSEWLAQVAHVLAVNEAHSGLDRGGDAMRPAEIFAPDIARQAVLRVVRLSDDVGLVLERDQAGNRPEDLILCDAHPVAHVGEYRCLDEVSLAE